MPSGITHDRITIWILPWVTGITYCLTRNGELTLILAGSYLFGGMMFGPDLDIHSLQYKRWGILKPIWLPYRQLLRHRSLLSHGPIVGTCLRVAYLTLITAIVGIFAVAIAQLCFGFPWNWQVFVREQISLLRRYPQEAIAFFLGLEIGAMSHSISDWIGSYRKRRLKSKLKGKQSQPKATKKRRAKIYHKK